MNKAEVAKKVLERIETQGTTRYTYIEEVDGKTCFCAVGHLMDECKVDMNIFKQSDYLNGTTVNRIIDDYLDPIVQVGFTFDELSLMQHYNDSREPEKLRQLLEQLAEG
jgi:hypothetical protein